MLNESLRKEYMEALGYSYDKDGILAMQKKYFVRSKDMDGVYGNDTDILLRNLYNFKLSGIVKNFKLEEFKCECGGRYCTGYPAVMSQAQLKMVQAIRTHYGKPMTVTCGLRCKTYNAKLNGSIMNSSHMLGYATDYYMQGVTDTLNNRKASIKWIKKQSNHAYSYGNGINSNGVKINAPYMGNALHTDVKTSVADVYPTLRSEPKHYDGQFPNPQVSYESRDALINDMMAFAKKYADDDKYHYKNWSSDKNTHYCPICKKQTASKYLGWNCIGYASAICYHGGIKDVTCSCSGLGNNAFYEKLLKQAKTSKATALATWKAKNGQKWDVIYDGGNKLKESSLQAGDVVVCYSSDTFKHVVVKADRYYIYDSTSGKTQISRRKYTSLGVVPKLAFRPQYTKTITRLYLQKGDKGDEVLKLQKFLNWYYDAGLVEDGIFGDATEKHVKKLQTEKNLVVDGKVGTDTVKAMEDCTNQGEQEVEEITLVPIEEPKKGYEGDFPNLQIVVPTNNAGKIVAKCKEVCYPSGTAEKKWKYSTGAPTSAFKTAYHKYTSHPHKKLSYSDCGYFTETIARSSGVDSSFKGFDWNNSYKGSKAWQLVHTGAIGSFKLKNGDVIEYKKSEGQHTLIIYDASKHLIAEAGRGARFDIIRKSTKYNDSNVKKSTIRVLRAKESTITTTRFIGVGDSRLEEVKKLQMFLNWYSNDGLVVDGKFGVKTETCVKAFQSDTKLTVDGKVGEMTLKAMKNVLK